MAHGSNDHSNDDLYDSPLDEDERSTPTYTAPSSGPPRGGDSITGIDKIFTTDDIAARRREREAKETYDEAYKQHRAAMDARQTDRIVRTTPGTQRSETSYSTGIPGNFLNEDSPGREELLGDSAGRQANANRDVYNRNGTRNRSTYSSTYEAMEWFYAQDEKQLAKIQRDLYEAGFMDKEPLVWGRLSTDESDATAWEKVLFFSQRTGEHPFDIIRQYAEAGAGARLREGADGPGRRKSDIAVMSPDDIKAIANETAKNALGRRLTDEEVAGIVSKFHSREKSEQSRANAVRDSETGGGTYSEPTSAQTLAEDLVREARPVEARAHDTANAFESFLSLIGGF